MIKRNLNALMNLLGYEIIRKDGKARLLSYDLGKEAYEAIQRVRPNTMLSDERLITLYQQTVFCEEHNIKGCFVECGVWKGGAVGLMALANLKHGTLRRNIHLFDSFQEICEPDKAVDGERAVQEVKQWSNGSCNGNLTPLNGFYDSFGGPGTLQGNKDFLEKIIGYDPDFLHYHKGWFQDTLPIDYSNIGEIAILRLDADWYASTKICLEYLYEKVVTGGFVIVDDYAAYDGCRKAVDEFMLQNNIVAYLNHIDEVGRYWIKS